MITKPATLVIASTLAAMAAASVAPVPARAECSRTSTGGILGGLAGAAAGIAIGSQIGSGTGRNIAMALGGLGGLILGNEIGRGLDCTSQQQAVQTQSHALESQPSGTTSSWRNPDDNASGSTTPTGEVWYTSDGRPCRNFTTVITHEGKSETVNGTACRTIKNGQPVWEPTKS